MRSTVPRDWLARRDAARPSPWPRRLGMLLSSCFLVTFMTLCTGPTFSTSFKEASANSLSLFIMIRDQYTMQDDLGKVIISITFSKGTIQQTLGENLSLTCNGIAPGPTGIHVQETMPVPRQPAGDVYQCVYTDEKGTKTPLFIPTPAGALAITSPAAGATVHVTDNNVPSPEASPTPTIPGALAFISELEIHYTLPMLPTNASTYAQILAICGDASSSTACGVVAGESDPATGTYLLSDANNPSGTKFHDFIPGSSGRIEVHTRWSWSMPPGGFHAIRIEYDDSVQIPVTWA